MSAFPGNGLQRDELAEIAALKKEVAKLKAERDILKKVSADFAREATRRFAIIAKHRHIWPVSWLCEVLDKSRSGLRTWLNRPVSARATLDAAPVTAIGKSFRASDRTHGVWRDVLKDGLASAGR